MKQCKCGDKIFNCFYSTEVTFTLDDKGTLTATDENQLGSDNIYICQTCAKEYQASDFNEIITK